VAREGGRAALNGLGAGLPVMAGLEPANHKSIAIVGPAVRGAGQDDGNDRPVRMFGCKGLHFQLDPRADRGLGGAEDDQGAGVMQCRDRLFGDALAGREVIAVTEDRGEVVGDFPPFGHAAGDVVVD